MNVLARLVVCALPFVGLVGGCSNQSEGQRCDANAADCDNGLVCIAPIGYQYGVCCPPAPAQSTAPACNPGIVPMEAGTDASDGAETVPDAAAEAAASQEASPDVAADTSDGAATEEPSPDATTE